MTGPRFVKPRSTGPHYVNNRQLYEALQEHQANVRASQRPGSNTPEPPRASEYIGRCIMLICERLSLKPNFVGYVHRDEMIADAITNCCAAIGNFNPEKSSNPFAYFTQIAYNAFIRRIQSEKSEMYKKNKNLQHMVMSRTDNSYITSDEARTIARDSKYDTFVSDFERKLSKGKGRRKRQKGLPNMLSHNTPGRKVPAR